MPFKFPGISQAYERKKEREGLVDPQGGAHLPSAAVQAFWPELQRATARLGSGETKALIDFVADLMPDDPTYGMPIPGAGMVRWRKGLEYPTAFLNRAIENPKEIDYLVDMLDLEKVYQKPMSLITPSYTQSYRQNPLGLVFSVNNPSSLKMIGPEDMFTGKYPRTLPGSKERYRDIKNLMGGKQAFGKFQRGDKQREYWDVVRPRLQKKMEQAPSRGEYGGEVWRASKTPVNREANNLLDFFRKQEEVLRKRPNYGSPYTNEAVFEISDPKDLVAVRMPDTVTEEQQPLFDRLRNLALDLRIPELRAPMPQNIGQQLKQAQHPLKGRWFTDPVEGFMYSSEYGPNPGLYF